MTVFNHTDFQEGRDSILGNEKGFNHEADPSNHLVEWMISCAGKLIFERMQPALELCIRKIPNQEIDSIALDFVLCCQRADAL